MSAERRQKRNERFRILLLSSAAIAALGVACTLKPQPLPPEDTQATAEDSGFGGSSTSDAVSPAPEDNFDASKDSDSTPSDAAGTDGDAGDAGADADASDADADAM